MLVRQNSAKSVCVQHENQENVTLRLEMTFRTLSPGILDLTLSAKFLISYNPS